MSITDKRIAKGNATVNALVKCAEEILASRQDTNALTVDELCRQCNVTKGAFYHHFDSKQSFFQHVYTTNMSAYMAAVVDEAKADHPGDPFAQIAVWIDHIARYTVEHRPEMSKYLYRGAPSTQWTEKVSLWVERVDESLIEWQAEGKLRSDVTFRQLHEYMDSFTYGMSSLALQGYVKLPIDRGLIKSFIRSLAPEA